MGVFDFVIIWYGFGEYVRDCVCLKYVLESGDGF